LDIKEDAKETKIFRFNMNVNNFREEAFGKRI
jgi:hypothetical protein